MLSSTSVARSAVRVPPDAVGAPTLPERLCPDHQVLLEPVGELKTREFYYCPAGGAVREHTKRLFGDAA